MKAVIISGGSIDKKTVSNYLKNEEYDILIASDRGLETVDMLGYTPDLIVGDFDSVDEKIIKRYETDPKTAESVMRFKPEKDYTDSHLAVERAIKLGAEKIDIFGATGNRIDHILGCFGVMYMALKKGVHVTMIDDNNKIQMTDDELILSKQEQYGKYVSVVPYSGDANGVTMKGFKYSVENAVFYCDESLGISNEIKDDKAVITVDSGCLIVIEST